MFDIAKVQAAPSADLLTPDYAVMLFVDHQPQMFFDTGGGDRAAIINSTVGLAKAALRFDQGEQARTVFGEGPRPRSSPRLASTAPPARRPPHRRGPRAPPSGRSLPRAVGPGRSVMATTSSVTSAW